MQNNFKQTANWTLRNLRMVRGIAFAAVLAASLFGAASAVADDFAAGVPQVDNVKFQQRSSGNGPIDISFDLTGRYIVKVVVTAFTNGVPMCTAKSVEGLEEDMELTLGTEERTANGVHLVWNAAKDIPAGLKGEAFTLKVTAEQVVNGYQVRYLDIGTGKELAQSKQVAMAPVGGTVAEQATVVEGYDLSDESAKRLPIARNREHNVITFYYRRAVPSLAVRDLYRATDELINPMVCLAWN